jgi:translation initiation factor IF-1
LNRFALTKTEPGTLAATKPLQNSREPSGGEFNALLADKTALAPLKSRLDLDEHNEAVSAKPVTLTAGLGRQLAAMETFESTAVGFQNQDTSGAGLEKESEFSVPENARLQAGGEFTSNGDNPDPGHTPCQFMSEDLETNLAKHSSIAESRPSLDVLSLPVVATPVKQIVPSGARSTASDVQSEITPNDKFRYPESEERKTQTSDIFRLENIEGDEPDYQPASRHSETTDMHAADARAGLNKSAAGPVPVGRQMIQLQDFETEATGSGPTTETAAPAFNSSRLAFRDDVLPVIFERDAHPGLSSANGNHEHLSRVSLVKSEAGHASRSDQMDRKRSAVQNTPSFPRLYIDEANGWAPGPSGMGRAVMDTEFLPPGGKGLQAISRSELIAAPPPLGDAYDRTADFAHITGAVHSEPEPGLGFEADAPVLSLDRPQSRRSEASDKSISSAETAGRMSLAKMAEETASGVQEMQTDNLTLKQTEANAAPQPILNSGTILASIRQLASELAEPQVFLSDAEEVRAEINGRMKSVRINLRPESLGGVIVHVHSQQDKLRIEIRVQNDDAGRALLPEIDSIAGALSGLGLVIDQVTLNAPGGGITVVQSNSDRGGGTASQNQSEAFHERPAGEDGSRSPERRKTELDEKIISQSRGIYI